MRLKTKMTMIVLAQFLFSQGLWAAPEIIRNDTVRIGVSDSGATKKTEYNIGNGDQNPFLGYSPDAQSIVFSNDGETVLPIGSGGGGGGGINLLQNKNFDFSSGTNDWTASEPGTFAADPTLPKGEYRATFNASDAGQTLSSAEVEVLESFEGRKCQIQIPNYKYDYSDASGDYVLKVINADDEEILAIDIPSTAVDTGASVFQTFDCPPSDNGNKSKIRGVIESTNNAGFFYFNEMFLGQGRNEVQVSDSLPACTVLPFTATSDFGDWMLADGRTVSRSKYPDYAACGTVFGTGDGSTTVHLPDMRGRVIRGTDNGAGRDPDAASRTAMNSGGATGDAVGSVQDDAFQGHWHRYGNGTSGPGVTWGSPSSAPTSQGGAGVYDPTEGNHGAPRISTETRMENAGMNYFVKVRGGKDLTGNTYETSGWFFEGDIGGANPSLGTSGVSSWAPISDGSLSLNSKPGSGSCMIACSSTNPATGSTCSAGNEVVGLVCDIPTAGKYRACFSTSYRASVNSGGGNTTFTVVETGLTDQTVVQDGGPNANFEASFGTNSTMNSGSNADLCGYLTFPTSGQKAIKLFYEQLAYSGTSSVELRADRNANLGNRSIRVRLDKWNESKPTPVFNDLKQSLAERPTTSSNNKISYVRLGTLCSASPCSIASQSGDITSVTRTGTGDYTVNFSSNFSAAPTCFCNSIAGSSSTPCSTRNPAVGLVQIYTGTTVVDSIVNAYCIGPK